MFHAVETRTFLVVRLDDGPWRVGGVGIEEHRFLRLRIILPLIQRLAIDWREFPFFQRFFFARFEAAQLFVLCHREPVFEQENAASRQHSLDFRRLTHELKIFIGAAKSVPRCILLNPSIGCFLIPNGEDNLAPFIGVFIKVFTILFPLSS